MYTETNRTLKLKKIQLSGKTFCVHELEYLILLRW